MLDKTTTILFISLELHNSYLFIPIHYGTSSVRDNIYDIIKMHDRYMVDKIPRYNLCVHNVPSVKLTFFMSSVESHFPTYLMGMRI